MRNAHATWAIWQPDSLPAEIVFFSAETVEEQMRIFEDVIGVVKEIDHVRGARHRYIAGRLISRTIEVLVPSVQRRGKKTPGLPFEGPLWHSVIPDARGSPAAQDIDGLLKHVALRSGFTSR